MILTTKNYRVVCDRAARSLTIQRAGTWAPVSELRIPDDPELAEAVVKAVEEIAGRKTEPAKADPPAAGPVLALQSDQRERTASGNNEGKIATPGSGPKPRAKKVNK